MWQLELLLIARRASEAILIQCVRVWGEWMIETVHRDRRSIIAGDNIMSHFPFRCSPLTQVCFEFSKSSQKSTHSWIRLNLCWDIYRVHGRKQSSNLPRYISTKSISHKHNIDFIPLRNEYPKNSQFSLCSYTCWTPYANNSCYLHDIDALLIDSTSTKTH